MTQTNTNRPSWVEDLKLASCLGFASALATAALFPYLLQVFPQMLATALARLPLPILIIVQSMQAAFILGSLSFFGLRLGRRVHLDAPWLRALLTRQALPPVSWLFAIALGILSGVVIIGLDRLFDGSMPTPLKEQPDLPGSAAAFAGFLSSFYGAICEEIQLRLFLMTLLAWLLSLVMKARTPAYWMAIFLAALLFGAGHLPGAAQVWPLDAVVVTRTIILNALAGIAFGWLFWKRGLEHAMIAHFSADLVLHVAAPLFTII